MGRINVRYILTVMVLITTPLGAIDDSIYEFVETAPMPAATAAHSSIALANGDVLTVGGLGQLFGIPIAVNLGRIYDAQTHQWRVLTSQMKYGRISPGIARLNDGKVIIAGGLSQSLKPMSLIECFDPVTETFSVIGELQKPRKRPRLNLLHDGRLLISGETKHCEILEPTEKGFRLQMVQQPTHFYHRDHVAVTLKDGTVMLIGGYNRGIERFDPHSETFKRGEAGLPQVYDDMAWSLLYDGRILMVGGQQVYTMKSTQALWIYDPETDQLTHGSPLQPSHNGTILDGAADVALVDLYPRNANKQGEFFLVCGGEHDPGKKSTEKDTVLNFAKIYNAKTNHFIDVGPMQHERDEFTAVALPARKNQARILLIGGYRSEDRVQGSCEIFQLTGESGHD